MSILKFIILGIIQGITEFIPVSSSGFLEISTRALGGGRIWDFHIFMEFVNLGTLLALVMIFRKEIKSLVSNIILGKDRTTLRNITITTIPVAIIGIFFGGYTEWNPFFSSLYSISISMIIIGILLLNLGKLTKKAKINDIEKITSKQALGIGIAQAFAFIPGISRLAITFIAGRIFGLNAKSSAKYSLISAIPVMCGVILRGFITEQGRTFIAGNMVGIIVANICAFIFGLIALRILLRNAKNIKNFKVFGNLNFVIGMIALILVLNI